MTNPEHLKILKQGVETWNRWRRDHPNVVPSLGGANLGGAKLSGDLAGNLRGEPREANLRGANLLLADLSGRTQRGGRRQG